MQLRPYQEQMIAQTREALREYRSVLLQGPTGCGKTALTVHMMKSAAQRGLTSMFCVHQNELLKQTSAALWEQKLEHGLIASGKTRSLLPAQVASVQTLVRRLHLHKEPKLIIIDEAHRSAASTYRKVLDQYPGAMVVGLTATPERTDGKGLGSIFDTIVKGPSVTQLIDAGYLADYDIFAPPSRVDVSHVKNTAGDYNKAELQAAIDKPTITGDAVAHYKALAYGKRCVVMCVSIEHGNHVVAQYNANGVPAAMIEGGMTDKEREDVLDRLASGELLVVANVQLLIEGVDIPAIEVVQWLRPTQSLIVWMQGCGRGLRPAPGKNKLLILDHVGNCQRHGLPDDDREWSLEGRKSRKRKADEEPDSGIQQCDKCYAVFRPGPTHCPSCGAPIERKQARDIQEVDGHLEKVDLDAERKARKKEQRSARTLRQLIELGVRRGMNKPAEWACITMMARQGRKPGPLDFKEAKKIYQEVSDEQRNQNTTPNTVSSF